MKFYFDLYVHFFTLRSMAFKLECIFDSHEYIPNAILHTYFPEILSMCQSYRL